MSERDGTEQLAPNLHSRPEGGVVIIFAVSSQRPMKALHEEEGNGKDCGQY